MNNLKKIIILLFAFYSVSAQAGLDYFCMLEHKVSDLEKYAVPDENKSWGMLNKEIKELEESKDGATAAEIIQADALIAEKTTVRDSKRNYKAEINEISLEVFNLKKEKSEIHQEAIRKYNEEGISATSVYCNGFTPSPFRCEAEVLIDNEISSKIAEQKAVRADEKQESKWMQRRQMQTVSQRAKNDYEIQGQAQVSGEESPGGVLGLFDMALSGFNSDMDGIVGDLGMFKSIYYSCQTKTELPKRHFSVASVPLFIGDETQQDIKVFYCMEAFLQRGHCLGAMEAANPDSGWEAAVIPKNGDEWLKFKDEKLWLQSHCENLGQPEESCRLGLKLYEEGDFSDGSISIRTQNAMSTNPSFQRVLNVATSDSYNTAFNRSKNSYYDENNCSFQSVDAGTDEISNLEETKLISCQKPMLDENNRLRYGNDGKILTQDYSAMVNLLECRVEEVCEQEVEEEIEYTEGCVSPFPVTEVSRVTSVPDGNCAIKFDKEAYTCRAEKVMDTRTCLITRNQEMADCEPQSSITYNERPTPPYRNRFHFTSDIKDHWNLWENNDENNIFEKVQGSYKGNGYFTVNLINREEDLAKYVVFKISGYHNHGKHAQQGLDGGTQRPWSGNAGDSSNYNLTNWFVINLQDTSGGEIDPPTWSGASEVSGEVTEVSVAISQPMDLGYYGHARNSKDCDPFGGSCYPNEKQYSAKATVMPSNPGEAWCTPIEEAHITDGAEGWLLQTPYAFCGISFFHKEGGESPITICPGTTLGIVRDEGSRTYQDCDDEGDCTNRTVTWDNALYCIAESAQTPLLQISSMAHDYYDLTQYACEELPDIQTAVGRWRHYSELGVCKRELKTDSCGGTDDEGFLLPSCAKEIVPTESKCTAIGPVNTTYAMTYLSLPGRNSTDTGVNYIRSNPEFSPNMTPELQESLDSAFLASMNVISGVGFDLPASECAAFEQSKLDYSACLAGGSPESCVFEDFWTKPYFALNLTGYFPEREAYDNTNLVEFWGSQYISEGIEPPTRNFNKWESGIQIPHLRVTKSIATLPDQCGPMNNLRDPDAVAAGL